jgi:predicted HicB family RNase H-like nuclease
MANYSNRLATRISSDVDDRLRLAALMRRMRLCQLLDQVLDQALPSAAELTEQMRKGTTSDS